MGRVDPGVTTGGGRLLTPPVRALPVLVVGRILGGRSGGSSGVFAIVMALLVERAFDVDGGSGIVVVSTHSAVAVVVGGGGRRGDSNGNESGGGEYLCGGGDSGGCLFLLRCHLLVGTPELHLVELVLSD